MSDQEETKEPCENCQAMILSSKLDLHEAYCIRNNKKCQICGEFVNKDEMEEHIQEEHSEKTCEYCKSKMQADKIEKHQKDECKFRPVMCEYCDVEQTLVSIAEHKEYCGAKTKQCYLCHQKILSKNLKNHENTCTGPQKVEEKKKEIEKPTQTQKPANQQQNEHRANKDYVPPSQYSYNKKINQNKDSIPQYMQQQQQNKPEKQKNPPSTLQSHIEKHKESKQQKNYVNEQKNVYEDQKNYKKIEQPTYAQQNRENIMIPPTSKIDYTKQQSQASVPPSQYQYNQKKYLPDQKVDSKYSNPTTYKYQQEINKVSNNGYGQNSRPGTNHQQKPISSQQSRSKNKYLQNQGNNIVTNISGQKSYSKEKYQNNNNYNNKYQIDNNIKKNIIPPTSNYNKVTDNRKGVQNQKTALQEKQSNNQIQKKPYDGIQKYKDEVQIQQEILKLQKEQESLKKNINNQKKPVSYQQNYKPKTNYNYDQNQNQLDYQRKQDIQDLDQQIYQMRQQRELQQNKIAHDIQKKSSQIYKKDVLNKEQYKNQVYKEQKKKAEILDFQKTINPYDKKSYNPKVADVGDFEAIMNKKSTNRNQDGFYQPQQDEFYKPGEESFLFDQQQQLAQQNQQDMYQQPQGQANHGFPLNEDEQLQKVLMESINQKKQEQERIDQYNKKNNKKMTAQEIEDYELQQAIKFSLQ